MATTRLRFDLTGKRFGRLSVLAYVGMVRTAPSWLCRCDCGTEKTVPGGNLRYGFVTSCGCAHADELRARNTTHGQRQTPEYKTWCNIRSRCSNPKAVGYEYYGQRGIKVCERWDDFENFRKDMGLRPSAQHSIDRINVNGNYEPGNCRWATRQQQMANRTCNRFVTVDGERMIQSEAARRAGISVNTFKYRQRMEAMNNGN